MAAGAGADDGHTTWRYLFAGADGRQWHAVRHRHRERYCGSRGETEVEASPPLPLPVPIPTHPKILPPHNRVLQCAAGAVA